MKKIKENAKQVHETGVGLGAERCYLGKHAHEGREACARRPERPHLGAGLNEGKGSRTKQWGQSTRGQKDKGGPGVEGEHRGPFRTP